MERICKIPKCTKWKIKVTQKSSTEKQPMLAFKCFSYSTSVFPNNQGKKKPSAEKYRDLWQLSMCPKV